MCKKFKKHSYIKKTSEQKMEIQKSLWFYPSVSRCPPYIGAKLAILLNIPNLCQGYAAEQLVAEIVAIVVVYC